MLKYRDFEIIENKNGWVNIFYQGAFEATVVDREESRRYIWNHYNKILNQNYKWISKKTAHLNYINFSFKQIPQTKYLQDENFEEVA